MQRPGASGPPAVRAATGSGKPRNGRQIVWPLSNAGTVGQIIWGAESSLIRHPLAVRTGRRSVGGYSGTLGGGGGGLLFDDGCWMTVYPG